MEEILASIRRIISEDDAPPAAAAPEPQPEPEPVAFAPEPEPEPAPAFEPEEDDVLELTETVEPVESFQSVGDLDVYTPAPKAATEPAWEPEPEPEPVAYTPEPEPAPTPSYTPTSNVSVSGDMTVVELVRAILEPKLNEWADQNLQAVVDDAIRQILTEKLGRVFR